MTSAPPPHETHTLDVMCGPCIAVLKAIRLGHGAWTRVMRELPAQDAQVKAVPDPAACCHACNVPQEAPWAIIPYSCLEGSMEQDTVTHNALVAAERLN